MFVIRSFKEMAKLHQAGIAPFRIVQEIGFVLLGLCGYVGRDIAEPVGVTQLEVDWLLTLPEDLDFMHYLGGWVYLCETEADLKQVTGMDVEFGKQHDRNPSILEKVIGWDSAFYLINADGTADYSLLFAATNNSGGPSWFIPKHLWQAAQIDKQIEANHQSWNPQVAQA